MRSGAMMLLWMQGRGWQPVERGYVKRTDLGVIFVSDAALGGALQAGHAALAAFVLGYEIEAASALKATC